MTLTLTRILAAAILLSLPATARALETGFGERVRFVHLTPPGPAGPVPIPYPIFPIGCSTCKDKK